MKIVAINGSPRKNGNLTQLLEVVRKEVEAAGVEFEVLQPGPRVKACMACYHCLNTGSLNWAYMNKILLRWQENGLLTGQQIQSGDRKDIPKGASGQLGSAELEAIQKLLKEG